MHFSTAGFVSFIPIAFFDSTNARLLAPAAAAGRTNDGKMNAVVLVEVSNDVYHCSLSSVASSKNSSMFIIRNIPLNK